MQKIDRQIIELLTEDSRLTPKKIASALSVPEATVKEKIRALEDNGVIVKYTAIINAEEYEEEAVEALIEVKVTPQRGHGFDKIAREIAAHDEVQNLYLMSGGFDLAVIVRGKSLRSVARFVSEKISTYETVISTATHFILKKYKVEGARMTGEGDKNRLSVQA